MNWRVLVAVMLLPAVVLAEEPAGPRVVTYPPGDDKIVVVKKGEAAPFAGQLFDDATALRWAVWLRQYKELYAIDMKAEQHRCKVKLDHAAELKAIEAERTRKEREDLRARLKAADSARLKAEEELRDPPFFKQPGVWFGIGILTTLATAITTTVAINASK